MKTRTFTQSDADTWDVLVKNARKTCRGALGMWTVTMSNKDLGSELGLNRRAASARAKRVLDFGMVTAVYGEVNGRPSPKVYEIHPAWLDRSPKVGDYYELEAESLPKGGGLLRHYDLEAE